jgi:hypothetical protein
VLLDDGGFYRMMLDGLAADPSPGQIWVSQDPAALTHRLELLALTIVEGRAPKEFLNRRLLEIKAATLMQMLSEGSDGPAAQLDAFLREVAEADVTLALRDPQLLLHYQDVDVLDAICDALARHSFAWFGGLTDPAGLSELLLRKPRIVAALATYDHDAGTVENTSRFIVPTADPDRGWVVVVRCLLAAPAPALDQVAAGSIVAAPGGVGIIDDPAVDKVWLVRTDEGHPGMMVSLRENSVAADAPEKAEEVALSTARRLIWRSLQADERLEATRSFCLVNLADRPAG